MRTGGDVRDGLVQRVVRQQRQQRAEDLLAHHRHAVVDLGQQLRWQQPARRIFRGFAQRVYARAGCLCIVAQRREALILAIGDDAGVLRVLLQLRIHPRHRLAGQRDEVRHARARQQHVVRRDAGLPGVEQLADHDAFHRVVQPRAGADDGRRLAAQLQRHRGEIGRGRAHHVVTDRGGAGEQQVVERQRRERLRHVRVAGHHPHFVGLEILRHLLGEQCREAWRELAHLHHRAVAGDQRVDQRADRQVQRIVPRHDDADHAARLRPQLGARRQEQPVGQAPARLHPAPAVGQRMADRREAGEELQQLGLFARATAEIGMDGLDHALAILAQQRLQRAQPGGAHGPLGHRLRPLRGAQQAQAVGERGNLVGGHGITRYGSCSMHANGGRRRPDQKRARSSTPHIRGGVTPANGVPNTLVVMLFTPVT